MASVAEQFWSEVLDIRRPVDSCPRKRASRKRLIVAKVHRRARHQECR
jgi:hypothetical protein